MQRTQIIQHAVKKENGIIKVGKSALLQPEVHYDKSRKATKWFDDTKLIKRKK